MYGTHHQSKRKTEFSAAPAQSVETFIGLHQTCEPDDCWSTAMLSIGTFGMRDEQRLLDGSDGSWTVAVDDPKRGRGFTTAEETKRPHHLHLERLLNCSSHVQTGGFVNKRSIQKPLKSAFNGFMRRPSFREPLPQVKLNEIIWGLLHKTALSENSALSEHKIRDDRVAQMPQKEAGVHEERGKWIRTDSEYIVLEI